MAGLEKKSRAELEQLSPTHVGQLILKKLAIPLAALLLGVFRLLR